MNDTTAHVLIATWFGAFLVEGSHVVAAAPFPTDSETLALRLDDRRAGRIVPEEDQLLASTAAEELVSRDRRLAVRGVHIVAVPGEDLDPRTYGHDPARFREILLARARSDLSQSWDPSIHVQEAVRALVDAEDVMNSVGERLALWAEHDRPPAGAATEGLQRMARRIAEGAEENAYGVPPPDPSLAEGRRALARLYLASTETRNALERSLEEAMPRYAPNLHSLVGPMLAARLISQAGNLERLAAFPASTIQVLGAEKAFFEHLRGRAPPPRHGLIFLHPRLHSAPRALRGRLARALAGKIAIAARLDRAGRPLDPSLKEQFEARAAQAAATPRRTGPREARRRSVRPLHGAARHR